MSSAIKASISVLGSCHPDVIGVFCSYMQVEVSATGQQLCGKPCKELYTSGSLLLQAMCSSVSLLLRSKAISSQTAASTMQSSSAAGCQPSHKAEDTAALLNCNKLAVGGRLAATLLCKPSMHSCTSVITTCTVHIRFGDCYKLKLRRKFHALPG